MCFAVRGSWIAAEFRRRDLTPRRRSVTPLRIEAVADLIALRYEEGMSLAEAGKPFRLSSREVVRLFEASGIPTRGAEEDARMLHELHARELTPGERPWARSPKPVLDDDRPRRTIPARTQQMYEAYERGATLEEVGATFGVTRERVRQLLKATDLPVTHRRTVRRARRIAEARAVSDELMLAFREGGDVARTARELGVTAAGAGDVVRDLATPADRAERSKRLADRSRANVKFTLDDLKAAIRSVQSKVGTVPSSQQYSRHAAEMGLPSLATVAHRFGSWNNALRAAGLEPLRTRRTYSPRWSAEACRRALAELASELGGLPTAQQYDLLASASDELPSLATVRNRLGRWSEISVQMTVKPHSHSTLAALGISATAGETERDEAVWLAYLAGELNDDALIELLGADLFTWHASYGPRPDA
jgi:hypothetical protein